MTKNKKDDSIIEDIENVEELEKHEKNCQCQECADEVCDDYYTELENKVKEYIHTAQQIQADFDNYRKKTFSQIADAKLDGQIMAISKLLPVLDSFASAKKMVTDEKLLEGFLLIENQIIASFSTLGVEKIEAVGQKFDPNIHNALAVVNEENLEDNIIKEEYQAGYKIGEKIIRYSQVIVNRREN